MEFGEASFYIRRDLHLLPCLLFRLQVLHCVLVGNIGHTMIDELLFFLLRIGSGSCILGWLICSRLSFDHFSLGVEILRIAFN